MRTRLINAERSVIVALDVPDIETAKDLAKKVAGVPKISGYKFGIELALQGLAYAVEDVRKEHPDAAMIYDHQKAGNDIPEMGSKFAKAVKSAGIDAAILFPFAGPKTQEAWIKGCQDADLHVLVGGIMTHERFLVSEGGYIADAGPAWIFENSLKYGVTDFVVPGTKLDWVKRLRDLLDDDLGDGNYDLYAPGFISQGGDISECGRAAGPRFHAIVGSAIYSKPPDQWRQMAEVLTSQIY